MIETTPEVARLIPLYKERKILQVSWPRMMHMVRTGTFPVLNISDEPITRDNVGEDGSGLRVKAEDLQHYIDSRRI